MPVEIHVGTSFTLSYLPKMQEYRFLETFSQLQNVKLFAQIIDGDPDTVAKFSEMFPTIRFSGVPLLSYQVSEQMKTVACPQYGAFIDYVEDLGMNDYVFFIDADITVQRQFTEAELKKIKNEMPVIVSLNARGGHSMTEELMVLDPTAGPRLWQFRQTFGDIDRRPVFNCGVIGMNVSTWKRTLTTYKANYPVWSQMVKHHASVQWFLSFMFNSMGTTYRLADYNTDFVKDIHSHCHEATAIQFFGLKRRNGVIVRPNGNAVLFAHAHLHPRWQELLK